MFWVCMPKGFRLRAGECCDCLHLPAPASTVGVTAHVLWPQQMLNLLTPSCHSKAAGRCRIWTHPPVLAGYAESATMLSTSASISGENLNCPPSLQLVPPEKQMNLSHIWSRCFSNFCIFAGSQGKWDHMWAFQEDCLFLVTFGTLGCQPHWFSKPDVLEACLTGADLRGQVAQCGAPTPHFLEKSACLMRSLPIVCCHAKGRFFFCETISLPLYPSCCGPFILYCGEQFIQFSDLFRRKWSICSCTFGVPMGGGEFRICCHLAPISK